MKNKFYRICSLFLLAALLCAFAGCSTAAAADGSGAAGILPIVAYMAVIFALLYFFMVRPEKNRKKKLDEMRDSLSTGDQITTIGGIVGKIVHIKDDFVVIETSEDRVRVEIAKWAIGSIGKASTQEQ
jgi:preprotein translocase subunit YajC